MADRWAALLRAVNLGSRNRVAMGDLRRVFEQAGCSDVATYIQSGNVVFAAREGDRATLARELERAVEDEFGFSSRIVLRKGAEIETLVRSHPFGPDTSKTHVVFLADKPSSGAVRALGQEDVAPDEVAFVGRDVVLRFSGGVQGARLTGAPLERRLGVPGTMRTWRTVERLAELATAPQAR